MRQEMADRLIQPGDFCCVPVSGEGGKLIKFGERLNGDAFTQYQHAEVYVGTSDEVLRYCSPPWNITISIPQPAQYGWTLGAYPGGARLVPLSCPPERVPGALWSTGAFYLTAVQRRRVVAAALGYQGVPYSWVDYLALAAHRFRVPVPQLEKFIGSAKSMICSTLVDKCYMDAGFQLFNDGRWPGFVTPADLAKLIHDRLVLAA
jgi:hypothetical protein